jgi:glycosyltransferase involved in cell wall biosynthesis
MKYPTSNLVDKLPLQGSRVAVAGLFKTRCGLQRGAKLMLADILRRDFQGGAIDLSVPLGYPIDDPNQCQPSFTTGELMDITDVIVHLNPPNFAEAVSFLKTYINSKTRIIGYWAWELQTISDVWRDCAELCSAIWTPSPFVARALLGSLPNFHGDIHVIPHQVDLDPMPTFDADRRRSVRESHGIRHSDFMCGVSFALGSNYARKNPIAAIDAFMRAFYFDESNVRLSIRCHDAQHHKDLYEHLLSYGAVDNRIHIFNPSSHPWPMSDFYGAIDAFISLHRSEGYGLQIAEAAQAGVSVLATAWGLAPDILARPEVIPIGYRLVRVLDPQGFYSQFPRARWAEPDIDEAASWLRLLRGRHMHRS